MQSVSKPLAALHEEASWFARAHEIRLLVVRVSGDLRSTVLRILPMLEFHADNFSPWVPLEDGWATETPGWRIRANRLVQDWERRREAFAKEGTSLPPAEVEAVEPVSDTVATFESVAAAVLKALQPPLRGLVLAFAPTVVESVDAFAADLETLLQSEMLTACRLVLVLDASLPEPQRLRDLLGEKMLFCNCMVDPKLQEQDIEAIIGAQSGPQSMGAAPSNVAPPRRVDDPPEIPRRSLMRSCGNQGSIRSFWSKRLAFAACYSARWT